MIAIIDYRAGNLASVARAFDYLRQPWVITKDAEVLSRAERIIFPGVGAAGEAMAHLRNLGLDSVIRDAYASGRPLLGLCLGTQIILDYSEEDDTPCLGLGLRAAGRPSGAVHGAAGSRDPRRLRLRSRRRRPPDRRDSPGR